MSFTFGNSGSLNVGNWGSVSVGFVITVCQAVLCLSRADVTISGYMAIMLFTAFYDVLSYMVRWYLDIEEADLINQKIAKHRAIRNGDCTYESDRKNDTASCTRRSNTRVF